jgi:hypothetical protein
VKPIKVDLEKNLLRIQYDPEKVTPQTMLETVGKQGFEGKIIVESH